MAIQTSIPAVLYKPFGNSISTERALKQIFSILEEVKIEENEIFEDRINASIDDVKTMLAAIK